MRRDSHTEVAPLRHRLHLADLDVGGDFGLRFRQRTADSGQQEHECTKPHRQECLCYTRRRRVARTLSSVARLLSAVRCLLSSDHSAKYPFLAFITLTPNRVLATLIARHP